MLKSHPFSLKLVPFDAYFKYEYVDVPTGNFFKKSVEKIYPFWMKTYLTSGKPLLSWDKHVCKLFPRLSQGIQDVLGQPELS
jgi:hypothetical protein